LIILLKQGLKTLKALIIRIKNPVNPLNPLKSRFRPFLLITVQIINFIQNKPGSKSLLKSKREIRFSKQNRISLVLAINTV